MKSVFKIIISASIFILLFNFLAKPNLAYAQNSGYEIESFSSNIIINKNTELDVTETITVDFNTQRHGIFRFIPIKQRTGIRNITTRISNVYVTDNLNNKIPFVTSKTGRNFEIKIGDPNKYVTGEVVYVINYTISNVVQRYDNHDEVYWNVVGADWDTTVSNPTFSLTSEYADIQGAVCFTGPLGSTDSNCEIGYDENGVIASSDVSINNGEDFTVAIILDKNNNLIFPGIIQKTLNIIRDNWLYVVAILPALVMGYFWYKKGRDITYGQKVYFGEESDLKLAPVFARKYLPTVYQPINGLTPSQIGTIVDERVDIHDIVAEIVELARLKYINIKQIKKNYELTIVNRDDKNLADYQKYLLNSLFPIGGDETINTKDFDKLKFYKYLETLKAKIYNSVAKDNRFFDGNPDNVRKKWMVFATTLIILPIFIFAVFDLFETNPFYILFIIISALISQAFAFQMPRKTAKGYALHRDIVGLKNYIKIGKWRHEVYEKNLFLEEMIPIAISLGVLNKLNKAMRELNIQPSYISTSSSRSNLNMNSFENRMSKAVLSGAPKSTSNSWSGGSGFSGGSSGGGSGGGGGGSW